MIYISGDVAKTVSRPATIRHSCWLGTSPTAPGETPEVRPPSLGHGGSNDEMRHPTVMST